MALIGSLATGNTTAPGAGSGADWPAGSDVLGGRALGCAALGCAAPGCGGAACCGYCCEYCDGLLVRGPLLAQPGGNAQAKNAATKFITK